MLYESKIKKSIVRRECGAGMAAICNKSRALNKNEDTWKSLASCDQQRQKRVFGRELEHTLLQCAIGIIDNPNY